ncbi:MAG: transposase [Propionibacteriaceae bacterium]|nr:transposase [Propionibacteriaceae bacterium]
MLRTHKVALDVTNVQATYLARACGTARFAYNWGLARWQEQYEAAKADPSLPKPSQQLLRRELNAVKREQYPWMMDVTKCAVQESIIDLGKAFNNFFAGRARYPRFHKKGQSESFRVSSGFFKVDGRRLRLPLIGWLRMREPLRWPDAKLVSVTIVKHRGRWFAAIVCELPEPSPTPRQPFTAVGVDVGVREYVTSNGEHIQVPRAYRVAEHRLRRAQQTLSRKQKGSHNRDKTKAKLSRLHGRVGDIRADWLHQTTRRLVDGYAVIGVEDLNVKGMAKNHHLAKSVLDAGFFQFRRQLEYKAPATGATVIVADRWFPSSKTCSNCGVKTKRLTSLSVRVWVCETCGISHHRDVNAAINLRNHAASSAVSACGEFMASEPVGLAPPDLNRLVEAGTRHQTVNRHV